MMEVNQKSAKLFNFRYVFLLPCVVPETICYHFMGLISGGALGYFLGGYVPPGTPNWHPVLKKNSPKIDTPF